MNRRILYAASLAAVPAALAAQQKPNIIYIMTDQHWAGAMSCAGNTDLSTPNLDRLAEHGVRFTNAYCSFPLSGPSRAAMFTGYMPSQTGMDQNEIPLLDSLRHNTLGQVVANAGYDCVYAGKWHVNTISIPDGEFGFRNIKDNGDQGLSEACVDYLRSRKKGKPFFLVASYVNPHNICEFARGQKTPHASVPPARLEDCPNLPQNFAVAPYDAKILRHEQKLNYSLYPTVDYSADDWRYYRNAYCRLIEAVDAEIGTVVDEIDRQNLWKNTVIIFTSDHGDGYGAHQWNQKTALYEEVANVPMIVCLPGGKNAGQVSTALVNGGIDLMPSVCEFAGAEVPHGRHGVSWKAAAEYGDGSASVTGKAEPSENEIFQDYIVTETNFKQTSGALGWMVRTPRYKYVLYDKGVYREQLYDMEKDRGEMVNLAVEAEYGEVVLQMREILRNWFTVTPGPNRARHLRMIPVR